MQQRSHVGLSDAGTADPKAEVPQLRPDVDLRTLAIAPEDAFVFSRIDGQANVREIQLATGLPEERVVAALRTLARVGAIEPLEFPAASRVVAASPVQAKDPAASTTAAVGKPRTPPQALPSDAPLEQRLDAMLQRLDGLDHYQLLHVPRDADKKTITSAYFRLVADFHPDKYYGQDLGETKAKLELVFQRLTLAQETLTRQRKRRAYDETLGPEQPLERLPPSPSTKDTHPSATASPSTRRSGQLGSNTNAAAQQDSRAVSRRAERPSAEAATESSAARPRNTTQGSSFTENDDPRAALRDAEPLRDQRPVSPPPGASVPPATKRSAGVGQAPAPPTPSDTKRENVLRKQRARASVARSFASMASARSRRSLTPPQTGVDKNVRLPVPPNVSTQSMARAMTASTSQSLSGVSVAGSRGSSQVRRYVQTAETELEADNPVAAANALRLALALCPDDDDLKRRLLEAEQFADRKMAGENLNQAKIRERTGDYQRAAKLYAKAARGRQSGELYAAAARCFRRDKATLKDACEHARKAVELDPTNPATYFLLADIYVEAHMPQSAITVLETATGLGYQDDAIQKLLSQLKRGE